MSGRAVLGIDLGGTNIRVGKVKDGAITKIESRRVFENGKEQHDILDNLFGLIDKVLDEEVEGIGMGIPGLIERKTGVIHELTNIPSWNQLNLNSILNQHYRIPVYLENDANCYAIGEKYFGKGKSFENFVGLSIGTGIGAGIISNSSILKDRNSGSGEFGMLDYLDGNYEDYCSSKFFVKNYKTTGYEEFVKAQNGDMKAKQIFSEFGVHLASVIKTILYCIDPELVVVGGSIAQANSFFHQSLMKSLVDFPCQEILKNLKIEYSDLKDAALLGAAGVYLDRTTSN